MKSQEFLANKNGKIKQQVNASKDKISGESVLEMLDGVKTLVVSKGKKSTTIDLNKDRPSDEQLVSMMTGPTGNLRAPTIRKGKTLLIGFNQDAYEEVFK